MFSVLKNKLVKTLTFVIILTLLLGTISVYNPKPVQAADSWSTGLAGGTARSSVDSIVYEGKIYYWGGSNGSGLKNTLDIYNISTNTWSTGASGGTARSGYGANVYDGKIYYWGGYITGGSTNTLDIYNIATNTWTVGVAGGTARRGISSSLYDGKIYYWGGCVGVNFCVTFYNTVDIYDITTGTWATGSAGGTARSDYGAAEYQGKIYLWGGYNGGGMLDTLDVYTIATDSWSSGAASGTVNDGFISTLYGDKIYSYGGETANGDILDTMLIYDISDNSWSSGAAGGIGQYDYAGSLYDGKMYYWGGYTGGGWDYTNELNIYDTGIHPNPTFETLPGDTRVINLTEGQNVATSSYTLQVKPYSPNGIANVKFYVDNVLICTDTTADADGIYSCDWDTTLYHSDVRVVATDPFARSSEITRTATVVLPVTTNTEDATVLPETGADLFLTP